MVWRSGATLAALSALIFVIVQAGAAAASPTISSVSYSPSSSVWIGESPTISVNCTDSQGMQISSASAQIVGSDGYALPNQSLSYQGGLYSASIPSLYLSKANSFSVTVYCTNNQTVQASQASSFSLYNFTVGISSVTPNIFTGSQMEADVAVKRNGAPVTSGVNFTVSVDGQQQTPLVTPPYDPSKGWVVYLTAPSSTGSHTLNVLASYDRVSKNDNTTMAVSDPIQFNVTSPTSTALNGNDTVSFDVNAFDHGSKILVNSGNLVVDVGSLQVPVYSVTPVESHYTVTFFAPSMDPGVYPLTAILNYGGFNYTDNRTVSYRVPVYGTITNADGGGVSAQLRFLNGGIERAKFSTSSTGEYSGSIDSGTYDLEATFPDAVMTLNQLDASSFYDPIRYYSFGPSAVTGIKVAGLYYFSSSRPFFDANVVMNYDQSKVPFGDSVIVYQCSSWDNSKKLCSSDWREVSAYVDSVKDTVTVHTTGLSAFAIGTLSNLSATYNLNDQDYTPGSAVSLSGVVIDDSSNVVPGATVTASIGGSAVRASDLTDSNGLFTLNFNSPSAEGNYTVAMSISRQPFPGLTKYIPLTVVKNRVFTIVFPDTVGIDSGNDLTQNLKVVNTGQSELFGLKISISGAPGTYYALPTIDKLDVGEEKDIPVIFSVPSNASAGTYSVKLDISNGEVSREKIFGMTVQEPVQTAEKQTPITGLFTGLVPLGSPQLMTSLEYVGLFAASAFTASFFLKRRKVGRERRGGDTALLLQEIKGSMSRGGRPRTAHGAAQATDLSRETDRRVSSSFAAPPADDVMDLESRIESERMESSDNGGDEDGKNN